MPYQRLDLDDLRTALTLRWQSDVFWTTDEADQAINEALQTWNLLTGQWTTRLTVLTLPGEPWVALPAALSYAARVSFLGFPLELTSVQALDCGRSAWERETTASGGSVPSTPRRWAPEGFYLFAIWPADALGNRQLVIDGVAATPTLTLASDYIDVDDTVISALVGEALHVAAFSLGAETPQAQTTAPLHDAFMQAALDKNQRLRALTRFRHLAGRQAHRGLVPIGDPRLDRPLPAGGAGGLS